MVFAQRPQKLQPYNITYQKDTDSFSFSTNQHIIYSCKFGNVMQLLPPLLGIYDIEVRDFMFYPYDPNPEVRKKQDNRISATLFELLTNEFFNIPEQVLVFTCDNTDNPFAAISRQKLFSKWHSRFLQEYEMVELEVETGNDSGLDTVYGGVIFRKDFPYPHILKTQLIDQAQSIVLEKFGN